jgi:hypothetical protein
MALAPEQVRRFHSRGFLVLDAVLPAELLNQLCDECERLQRAYRRRSHIEQGAGCILGEYRVGLCSVHQPVADG